MPSLKKVIHSEGSKSADEKAGGVHAPHRKNTAAQKPELLPTPSEIVLPMSMHIGARQSRCQGCDEVKVGQLIAEAGGFVSSPVYTGVSGKVKAIDSFMTLTGQRTAAVTHRLRRPADAVRGRRTASGHESGDVFSAVRTRVVGLGGAASRRP